MIKKIFPVILCVYYSLSFSSQFPSECERLRYAFEVRDSAVLKQSANQLFCMLQTRSDDYVSNRMMHKYIEDAYTLVNCIGGVKSVSEHNKYFRKLKFWRPLGDFLLTRMQVYDQLFPVLFYLHNKIIESNSMPIVHPKKDDDKSVDSIKDCQLQHSNLMKSMFFYNELYDATYFERLSRVFQPIEYADSSGIMRAGMWFRDNQALLVKNLTCAFEYCESKLSVSQDKLIFSSEEIERLWCFSATLLLQHSLLLRFICQKENVSIDDSKYEFACLDMLFQKYVSRFNRLVKGDLLFLLLAFVADKVKIGIYEDMFINTYRSFNKSLFDLNVYLKKHGKTELTEEQKKLIYQAARFNNFCFYQNRFDFSKMTPENKKIFIGLQDKFKGNIDVLDTFFKIKPIGRFTYWYNILKDAILTGGHEDEISLSGAAPKVENTIDLNKVEDLVIPQSEKNRNGGFKYYLEILKDAILTGGREDEISLLGAAPKVENTIDLNKVENLVIPQSEKNRNGGFKYYLEILKDAILTGGRDDE